MAIPAGVIFPWPDTAASIPAGYQRVAALDDQFVRGSNVAGGTGSGMHNHSEAAHLHNVNGAAAAHSGSSGNAALTLINAGATSGFALNHTHLFNTGAADSNTSNSAAGDTDTALTLPNYLTVIYIESLGTHDIPAGIMAWYDDAIAPSGNWDWMDGTAASPDSRNRQVRGASVGNDGGSLVATNNHTHTSPHTHAWAHEHAAPANSLATTPGNANTDTTPATTPVFTPASHLHSMSGTTGGGGSATAAASSGATGAPTATPTPPSVELLAIRCNTDSPVVVGLIAIWMGLIGDIPSGWSYYAPLNDTNLFPHCLNTPANHGNAVGSATHAHNGFNHVHNSVDHNHAAGTFAFGSHDGGSLNADVGASARTADPHDHGSPTINNNQHGTLSTNPALGAGDSLPPYTEGIYIIATSAPPPPTTAGGDALAVRAIRRRRNAA